MNASQPFTVRRDAGFDRPKILIPSAASTCDPASEANSLELGPAANRGKARGRPRFRFPRRSAITPLLEQPASKGTSRVNPENFQNLLRVREKLGGHENQAQRNVVAGSRERSRRAQSARPTSSMPSDQ
jgi:hypothetical protein